ncbi:MAG: gliding motility lipoprotein GldD [Bacteroidetes bacterium]|nr:gliding motility lipoprotein GldD [Bacteroidota bacterium]
MRMFRLLILMLAAASFSLAGCDDDDDEVQTPRPRGYFRIALPEKKWVSYDAECPYTFEMPDYARVTRSMSNTPEPCWRDVQMDRFGATVYLSYKEITNDTMLEELINTSWQLTEKHRSKAQGRKEMEVIRPEDKVYGTLVDVGASAATAIQFYLTDSTKHFIRGSLYFMAVPNKDSLKPVLDFIRQDVEHITQTLKWKDVSLPKGGEIPAKPQPAAEAERKRK